MPVPVWLFLILFTVMAVVTAILEPRRRKEAKNRRRLFEERNKSTY
jgi:hypothetical protein